MRHLTHLPASLLALVLAGCGGSGGDGGGLLDLNDLSAGASPASLVLLLDCPASVSPGTTVDGFKATLTDDKGKPVAKVFVALNATQGASVDAPPSTPASFGANTDAAGEVPFALGVSKDSAVDSSITVKGTVKTDRATATKSCVVPVRGNSFVLTKPASNGTQQAGLANAQPVEVLWTTASGKGVKGSVMLSATSNGTFTFDTSQRGSSPATVETGSNGRFANQVYFVCGDAGFSTITAQSSADGSVRDTKSVQCLDPASYSELTVSPATVTAGSTDPASYPKLSYTVYSASNKPLAKQSVTFSITRSAGGDKLNPSTGTTDASGVATSIYQPGSTAGSVTVQGCVAPDNSICASRTITVQ